MFCQLGSLPDAGRELTRLDRITARARKVAGELRRKGAKALREPVAVLQRRLAPKRVSDVRSPPRVPPPLRLRIGERVRVKSLTEIEATLDDDERCGGLAWMSLMEAFCGGRFTVAHTVSRFFDERRRLMLRSRNVVLLEGVYCMPPADCPWDYAGCERMCLLFWHEAWLERYAEANRDAVPPEVA